MASTPSPKWSDASSLWPVYGMAFELLGAILLFTAIGWGIDYALNSGHRWTLVGALIGITAGGFQFIRKAIALNKKELERYRREQASRERARPDSGQPPKPPIDRIDQLDFPPDFDKF